MKNIIFSLLTILFITTSCSKDDDLDKSIGIPSNTLTAKIDGHTFTAEAQSQINNVFVQFFSIAGAVDVGNGEYETLAIILDFPIGETLPEMTYQFDGPDCIPTTEICGSIAYGVRIPDDELTHISASEGGQSEVVFTDLDYRPGGRATGTFSAILTNEAGEEIHVTDGKFNVEIAE